MDEDMKPELTRAVVFAILMQDIEHKAPSYVLEKWHTTMDMTHDPTCLLDADNLKKLNDHKKKWRW